MESDFIYARSSRKLAESFGLQPDELAIIDLVACGWSREEAFKLIYRVGMTWTKKALGEAISEITSKPGAKQRRKLIKGQCTTETDAETTDTPKEEEKQKKAVSVADAVSKENMLQELVEAKMNMVPGSKEWIDVNKMIADITRMKQEEVRTEDNTVNFFLPMKCYHCELYRKNKESKM